MEEPNAGHANRAPKPKKERKTPDNKRHPTHTLKITPNNSNNKTGNERTTNTGGRKKGQRPTHISNSEIWAAPKPLTEVESISESYISQLVPT
jgi:hypothetical protein